MGAGDQEQDGLAALLVADVKVTETAEVAEGDATAGVETVAANAVIDLRLGQRRRGFESGIESLQRRAAVQCTMRSLLELARKHVQQAPSESAVYRCLVRVESHPLAGGAGATRVHILFDA